MFHARAFFFSASRRRLCARFCFLRFLFLIALVTVATSGWAMPSESELMAVLVPDIFLKLSDEIAVQHIITITAALLEMTTKPSVLQSGP